VFYKEYIDVLYELECMRRGRPIVPGLSFGARANQLAGWLQGVVPAAIDVDLVHLRNAVAHKHWTYEPDRRVITVQDGRWRREYTSREVYALAKKMFTEADALRNALAWQTKSSFLRVIGPMFIQMLEAGVLRDGPTTATAPAGPSPLDQIVVRVRQRLNEVGWTSRAEQNGWLPGAHGTGAQGTSPLVATT
jgi:hypothetical protein